MSRSVISGIAAAAAAVGAFCLVLGIAQLFFDIPDVILSYASCAVLGIACYAAGYSSTQIKRSMGLVQGLLCGLSVFLISLASGIVFGQFIFSDMTLIKAAVCLISGGIGGIKGVNTKKTRERH